MTYLLVGLAVVAGTDTLQRFSPWPLPRLLIRLITLAGGLAGAHTWAADQWVLQGMAAAGVAIVVPLAVNALSDAGSVQTVVPARRRGLRFSGPATSPRSAGRRVPELP